MTKENKDTTNVDAAQTEQDPKITDTKGSTENTTNTTVDHVQTEQDSIKNTTNTTANPATKPPSPLMAGAKAVGGLASAGGAIAGGLLIAGPIGIAVAILLSLIGTALLGSAGKDVKEIYDTKNAQNFLNNLQNNLEQFDAKTVGETAKTLLKNPKIETAITKHNKSDVQVNKINEETIDSFVKHFANKGIEGNNKLQENFQKIVNHYQEKPLSAISLGMTLRDIYNKNCEKDKKLGLFDFKALEDPIGLFNNLKDDSKDKFVELVASIANNPQIIDEFAKDPSQINKLMQECKEKNGDIGVIEKKINEMGGTTKEASEKQENNNEKTRDIKALLSEAKINQTPSQKENNSEIPNAKEPNTNQR